MSMSLEQRIRRLEIIEAAKAAMYRYWRCLDYKLFDQLGDCFTETAEADWGDPTWRASGRAGIVTFLTANESRADIRLSHFGHNPEVTPLSDDEAFGYFKLEDWVTMSGATVMKGFGRYDMKFKMGADGTWRIADLKLSYAYREETSRFIDDRRLEMTPGLTR